MIRRRLSALLALAAALAFAAMPVLAAYATITLQSSAQQTASGNGAWQPAPTVTQLVVVYDITAGTTVTAFDAWIQGTNDSTDSTGYDVACDATWQSTPTSTTSPTINANKRDIVDGKTTTTAERFVCVVKNYPWKYVRAKWLFTGTNITFSVTAGSK